MKAVIFDKKGAVRVGDTPYPKPSANEVTVRVRAAGLCGTDLHIFEGSYPARYPLIAGHEFAGEIIEVGERVTKWEIGRRVTVEPNFYCGECLYCQSNRSNMCTGGGAIGVTRNGAFAEFVSVPANNIFILPDEISFDEAVFVEPLACVVYAMRRLNLRFGDRTLILGCGPMGLLVLKAVMAGGSSETVCMDISHERLEIAKLIGANKICSSFDELDALGSKYDVVIDATGNVDVIANMFSYADKRAKILQFGCAPYSAKISISPFEIFNNDWEIIGTYATCFTFHQAITLLKNRVITSEYILSDFLDLEGLACYLRGEKPVKALKIIIRP